MKRHTILAGLIASLPGLANADLKVLTDIGPVHGLVASVMDGIGKPEILLGQGTDPHHFSLKPSDAKSLSSADLVVWIGPELTPGLEKPIAELAANSEKILLSSVSGTTELEARSSIDEHDEHDEHDQHEDHAEHDDHEDHGHAHHGFDPHMWLDPENANVWLGEIASRLSKLDPENADRYRANADVALAKLSALMTATKEEFAGLANRSFFAAHDSYQYFEKRFDLQLLGSITLSDAAKPGPAHITELREAVETADTECLAIDLDTSPDLVETVTEGTALRAVEIDQLGWHLEPGPDFYEALISDVAKAFQSCLVAQSG